MIFADDTADEILECGGFYCTTTSEGDLIVTGLAEDTTFVVIPEEIDGCSIVEIADNAFAENTTIESVDIAESVTIIGDCAFSNCTSLTTVTGAEGVQEVGSSILSSTAWLEECTGDVAVLSDRLVV
ncbi:MAG: leucine-rich repeat domain-containing protein [Ruminococcus sp.]|nr:leucine-rich repeat domain-containing protein [Ruminococcus sp.]